MNALIIEINYNSYKFSPNTTLTTISTWIYEYRVIYETYELLTFGDNKGSKPKLNHLVDQTYELDLFICNSWCSRFK